MISLLLALVIYGLIFYLLHWAIGAVGLPEPFSKVANVVLIVAAVIVIIGLLTGGVQPFPFLGRV